MEHSEEEGYDVCISFAPSSRVNDDPGGNCFLAVLFGVDWGGYEVARDVASGGASIQSSLFISQSTISRQCLVIAR